MTANQVIVLLDVSRGFDAERHLGTVDEDVKKLLKENLIKEGGGFTYELTWKGKAVVDRILEQAELR